MGLDSGYGIGSLKPGVCTSTTRPAVPFDGQTISETDTDQLKVYNGTSWIGVGGLAPVIPTSIAATGGSSSLSGATATFTGTSTISLNGIFTATYNAYRIIIEVLPSTTAYLRGRLRVAGTDNATAGNYNYVMNQSVYSTGATSMWGLGPDPLWHFAQTNTTSYSVAVIDIAGAYSSSKRASYTCLSTNPLDTDWGGGQMTVTTSYDGITFYPSTGTFTGTVTAYGYAL